MPADQEIREEEEKYEREVKSLKRLLTKMALSVKGKQRKRLPKKINRVTFCENTMVDKGDSSELSLNTDQYMHKLNDNQLPSQSLVKQPHRGNH